MRKPFEKPVLPLWSLPWPDFDLLARGEGGPEVVRKLRDAERSRRLLLLRGLVDEGAKYPELLGPLPSPEWAWELLVRVEKHAPAALEIILAHPYTGSWAGYTTRLLHQQITGVCPLWMHLGHVHALAAAAAVHAGLDFRITVPLWHGEASLPTLGTARLAAGEPFAVAEVDAEDGTVAVTTESASVLLPEVRSANAPGWQGVREIVTWQGERRLSVRLDDVDPYRGLYEPLRPRRLRAQQVETWRSMLAEAWRLLTTHLPAYADALPAGLDSVVPAPAVPFRLPSASTGEAFGSAVISGTEDPLQLAAALVHEFQHIRLGGLMHLTQLHEEDARERFYAPWRPDPRPLGGVIHGIYAFFGMTAFWRALVLADAENGLAAFEFALARAQVWRALRVVREDGHLTATGRRFLDGVAAVLGPWQAEPVDHEQAGRAAALASDHYAGWRIRHLRPDPGAVDQLVSAWRTGMDRPSGLRLLTEPGPTPVPDGQWTTAREDLLRLRLGPEESAGLSAHWRSVPGATGADYAYVDGRPEEAADGYRAELDADADAPSSLVGLGLALSATGTSPAARALLHHPELVRAVHRKLRTPSGGPSPEEVATWVGRVTH